MSDDATRVLVTGGAGFVGSAVCRAARARAASVTAWVRREELPADPIEGVTYETVDWSDAAALAAAIQATDPSAIVHAAGSTGRGAHGADPSLLYEANVTLVWRLLDAVVRARSDATVVLLSSAAVYGPGAASPIPETAPVRPVGHYATSKLAAEVVGRAFAESSGLSVAIARVFNVIGPGEPGGSVTTTVTDQLGEGAPGEPVTVRLRECASVRDFVDVDDVATALLLLGAVRSGGQAYNVATGVGHSVAELAEAAASCWGRTATLEVSDACARGTAVVGDSRTLRALGWEPRYELKTSLERVAAHRGLGA